MMRMLINIQITSITIRIFHSGSYVHPHCRCDGINDESDHPPFYLGNDAFAMLIIIRVFRSGSWEALPPLPYPVADACMVCLNYLYDDDYDTDDDADDNANENNDDVNLKKAVTTIGGRRRLWLMGGSDYPQRL